ncbi:hypothetical protein KIN20_019490 [Parelaphostrongylus tenuis]|nr:hypothetical protein KIN20_019490 [Parelaphostrongylus tenuis]
MDEVIPRRRFSIHDWIYYVKTLRKCIDCSATEVRPRHIDRAKLVDKLSKHGVVDRKKFNLGRCPRFIRIKAFIRARDSSVFCHLRPSIGARDKLRIMEECYRRLVWQREDNYTSASLPRVKMSLFAECVIDRMRDIDSLWQPPAVFKQWITPWFHVSMSSKQSSSLKARNPAVDLLQLRHSPYDEPER